MEGTSYSESFPSSLQALGWGVSRPTSARLGDPVLQLHPRAGGETAASSAGLGTGRLEVISGVCAKVSSFQ
ncbi:hypothetical protein NDU88_005437 [Pleurodeles waltl]|uniref:Uncharacterized protein n=1 Tax=Pleurodeles waltl TaxID=8319 RepID=A0AAV7L408_PLEWA|nr:hypothetical protein NDU88_005437 [Pleurodeles waltl]